MTEKYSIPANVSAYLIDDNMLVLDALAKIDKGSGRALFVQQDGHLVAALTDGDIRRHILANGDLKAPVREVANYHPLSLSINERDDAIVFMREHSIDSVPLVDTSGHIVDIVTGKQIGRAHV